MTTASVTGDQLNFTIDRGAVRTLVFSPQNSDGTPLNMSGLVFEFVVEANDGTKTLSILSTDVSNPMGAVVVDNTAHTLTLTMNPAATSATYANRGGYSYWAIWVQPGTTSAYTMITGQIMPTRVAQP
jgi:hypothetical protein